MIEVGTELPAVETGPVTRAMLALFAGASGDHNPVHIDTDVARAAGFDDVFAHGMVAMGYLGRVLVAWFPPERVRSLGGRFRRITPVHARPPATAASRRSSRSTASGGRASRCG